MYRNKENPNNTCSRQKFTKHKKDPAKVIRLADIKEDPILTEMVAAWERVSSHSISAKRRVTESYRDYCAAFEQINYSPKDAEKFSLALGNFQSQFDENDWILETGAALSAIVNVGKDQDYTIYTHAAGPVFGIGYRNKKNLVIHGDVGQQLGRDMTSGKIALEGSSKSMAATLMKGGTIIINENAGSTPGCKMEGGTLIINGDVEDNLGEGMKGGTIIVHGHAGTQIASQWDGGKIILHGPIGDLGRLSRVLPDDVEKAIRELHIEGGLPWFLDKRSALWHNYSHGDPRIYHKGELLFGDCPWFRE